MWKRKVFLFPLYTLMKVKVIIVFYTGYAVVACNKLVRIFNYAQQNMKEINCSGIFI